MSPQNAPTTRAELKSERVDPESHPAKRWKSADDGRSLALEHQFGERTTALAFIEAVARLAVVTGACPKIEHVLGRVRVSLTSYEKGTVTERVRLLAKLLTAMLDLFEATEKPA